MKMTQADYLSKGGTHCPSCGSNGVESNGPPHNDLVDEIFQDVSCPECHAVWCDEYQLVGYDNLETGD